MRIRCRGKFSFSRVASSGANPEQRQGRERPYEVSLGAKGLRETGQLESPAVSVSRRFFFPQREPSRISDINPLSIWSLLAGLSFFVWRHLAARPPSAACDATVSRSGWSGEVVEAPLFDELV